MFMLAGSANGFASGSKALDAMTLITRCKGRVRYAPEVFVCTLCQLIHLLLEGPACPVNGEMDVLEQHPPTILVSIGEVVHGNGLLTLAQRDS